MGCACLLFTKHYELSFVPETNQSNNRQTFQSAQLIIKKYSIYLCCMFKVASSQMNISKMDTISNKK